MTVETLHDSAHGPVNCTAPNAVTNKEFTRTLAGVLKRPALLPAPRFAMRWALGTMSDELLMTSIGAVPDRLQECRYPFRHPTLQAALQHLLGRA